MQDFIRSLRANVGAFPLRLTRPFRPRPYEPSAPKGDRYGNEWDVSELSGYPLNFQRRRPRREWRIARPPPKSPAVSEKPDSPDRFNEEKATYSLRGAGAPDLEAGIAAIRAVVKTLPVRPGVYRMLDARGDVLYVGKARALKNRVNAYTQVARQTKRLLRMVSQTRSMQIVTTHNEAEALLLEAQLIKRYRPPYNVLLRDDKSFPFILLREDHDYPRWSWTRG